MDTATKPIITTTSLSFLIHSLAFAGLVLVYGQTTTLDAGVGRGVEIQLISSVLVSDQQENDVPRKQEAKLEPSPKSLTRAAQSKFSENILTSLRSTQDAVVTESEEKEFIGKSRAEQQYEIKQNTSSVYNKSVASVAQSTNTSQTQHSILELLHSSISSNKEYPYLARRQRREGVATVSFVLHPDGTIDDTHLVVSSHATILDRAALSAVKKIAPFVAAKDYLEQSEKFQIDIEFDLL